MQQALMGIASEQIRLCMTLAVVSLVPDGVLDSVHVFNSMYEQKTHIMYHQKFFHLNDYDLNNFYYLLSCIMLVFGSACE